MKSVKETTFIYALSTLMCLGCDGARILGVVDVNGISHFTMLEALLMSLAARGHDVVMLSHFPQKTLVPNYTDIDISDSLPTSMDTYSIELGKSLNHTTSLHMFWALNHKNCREILLHQNVRTLLASNQTFDLIITEIFASECTIGFSHRFRAPLVSIDTSVGFPWAHGRVGSPDHPAYLANYFLPYTSKMTFWQRLTNTVFNVGIKLAKYFLSTLPTSVLLKDIFGEETPTFEELSRNTSLILVNSHFSLTEPRPTVPNYIEVGGLHIKVPKPLPQDIKIFMEESQHGVVYFSLGSLFQVQSFSPQKLSALMSVFTSIPERVLLKYTGNYLPGKPENVLTRKWFPQQDILRHWNIKAFVSHGGQMSIQEAVYAGVPVIGIPIFGDQMLNIVRLVGKGMAVKVCYDDLTNESFFQAIRTVIDDRSYSENARRVSALFRDRPMSPMDTAVYWVEYVIRHRGAPHLRSAGADMPLYQYLLLDVITVLLLVLVGSVWVTCCAVKVTLRLLRGDKVMLRPLPGDKVGLRSLPGDVVAMTRYRLKRQ